MLRPPTCAGDDKTWALNDWDWDPFSLSAQPMAAPDCFGCQALKRRKQSGGGTFEPVIPPSLPTAAVQGKGA